MSTSADADIALERCRPTEGTPVAIDADALASTADAYLRSLARRLDAAGYVPAELVVEADFDADGSLATQAEADRVRTLLGAADFLGAGTVRLEVEAVGDPRTVRPAISALRERAVRDGLALVVRGADALDI